MIYLTRDNSALDANFGTIGLDRRHGYKTEIIMTIVMILGNLFKSS